MLQTGYCVSQGLKFIWSKIIESINVFISAPDPEEPHEMGDPEKMEMTEEESDAFDEKRNEAMAAFSDADW
jgi:hypothetical protein